MIQSELLLQFPEIVHGFSDKTNGNMSLKNVKFKSQNAKMIYQNREQYLTNLSIQLGNIILNRQVHGTTINIAGSTHVDLASQNESAFETGDGLITVEPNLYLTVFAADCLPLLLYEPIAGIVSTIHAGWRGLSQDIITKTLEKISKLGGNRSEIRVWLAPHIHVCHYDLDPKAESYKQKRIAFQSLPGIVVEREGRLFLDLTLLAMRQLEQSGILVEHIDNQSDCTACRPERYYSYHQSHGKPDGIMMGVIGRKR